MLKDVHRVSIACLLFLASSLCPVTAAESPASRMQAADKDFIIYTMSEGDTLQFVAEQFMGGEEYLSELLQYNKVSNPASVGEGSQLAIPRKIRNNAIAALSRAENALAKAMEAKADEYAMEEMAHAERSIGSARQAREEGSYDQAVALSQLGVLHANRARTLADERAPIQQPAKIIAVHGTASTSADGGSTWNKAAVGEELNVASLLKTEAGSRARLELGDGSVIQVLESSQFQVQQFLLDRRTGRRTSKLRVILGNILGEIKPKEHEESTFEINSGTAAIAIRGTELRVGADGEQVARLSVLEGRTAFEAGSKTVDVPSDFGTYAVGNKPPAPPVELLDPPGVKSPAASILTTAVQRIGLAWNPLKNRKLDRYHVEIARDQRFDMIVDDRLTEATSVKTEVLDVGSYYWRVTSIDRNGLEGKPGDVRQLFILRNLGVEIRPAKAAVDQAGVQVIGPDNYYLAMPSKKDTSVAYLETRLNEEAYQQTGGKITIPSEGSYTLSVRGVGADGVQGDPETVNVRLDSTPPEMDISISPTQDDRDEGKIQLVTLSATDDTGVELLEYRIDNEAYKPYDKPLRVNALLTYDLAFRAKDMVGNESPEKTVVVQGELVPRGE